MSETTFKVPYTKIVDILPHPNADRLAIAVVYDFRVIVSKDTYKPGDEVFLVPIDSIVPADLENLVFGKDSKIKLHHFRVKQIKIRGVASQGLIINKEEIKKLLVERGVTFNDEFRVEEDYATLIGVTKYEPPEALVSRAKTSRISKPKENPYFHMFNGVENIKWFPLLFDEKEEVVVQCKLHGTNVRFGILPVVENTLWKKLLKFFNLLPKYEKCYGSNRVQISSNSSYKGFFGYDLYGQTLKKFDVFSKIKPNEIVFGEIIGPKIQKNYTYGHTEPHLVIFDVKLFDETAKTYKWLSPDEVEDYAKERGFDFVPVLYKGPYIKDFIYSLTKGPSVYCPAQLVREGIVIKSRYQYNDIQCSSGKRCLKWINEDYLSNKDNTDFH